MQNPTYTQRQKWCSTSCKLTTSFPKPTIPFYCIILNLKLQKRNTGTRWFPPLSPPLPPSRSFLFRFFLEFNILFRPFLHFSFVRRMNVELNFFEYAGLLVQEVSPLPSPSPSMFFLCFFLFVLFFPLKLIVIIQDQHHVGRQFIELYPGHGLVSLSSVAKQPDVQSITQH